MRSAATAKEKRSDIPANLKEQAQEAHERLVELVAEGDDELMEKFFEAGTIGEEASRPVAAQRDSRGQDFPGDLHLGSGQHRR